MENMDPAVVEHLFNQNPRFRMLYEEHQLLEKELKDFERYRYLTPELELKRRKIQKIKLAGKDEMKYILRKSSSASLMPGESRV